MTSNQWQGPDPDERPTAPGEGPGPSIVWMVHRKTGMDGLKGRLSLEDGGVLFDPDDADLPAVEFPFSVIRKVRRVLGSPVLEVTFRSGFEIRVAGFYFIEPPDLTGGRAPGTFMRRHRGRRDAAVRLQTSNSAKKAEISAWALAIREHLRT